MKRILGPAACRLGWLLVSSLALSAAVDGPPEATPTLPPPAADLFQQDVAFSADGRWLAFSEYSGGADYKPDRWSVQIVALDGSERRVVLGNAQWVSWAPDGQRLVLSSPRDGNPELYVVDRTGRILERLTEHPARDSQPAWSPRGDRIAFMSDRDGGRSLFLLHLPDRNVVRLTRGPDKDFNPAWAPDGERIVFYREKGDARDQLWVVGADGQGERNVTNDGRHSTFPCFVPKGRIGFASGEGGGGKAEPTLFTIAADGSDRAAVGRIPAFFARWSPDGGTIAFVSGGWPRSAIYLADAEGRLLRKLVN